METSKTVESSSPSLLNTALTTESTEKSPQFAGKDSISNLVSQNDPDQLNDLFGGNFKNVKTHVSVIDITK